MKAVLQLSASFIKLLGSVLLSSGGSLELSQVLSERQVLLELVNLVLETFELIGYLV